MTTSAPHRRILALTVAWCGIGAALGVFAYSTVAFDPNQGHFAPPWVSFVFIAAVAVAIMAANIAGRLKMTDVVLRAFEIGFKSAEQQFRQMKGK